MSNKELLEKINEEVAKGENGLLLHAKRELDLILQNCKDEESRKMQKLMNDGILRVVYIFAEEHHSGFSAGYAIKCIDRLLKYFPISPITEKDFDSHPWDRGDRIDYQCTRCSHVWKEVDKRTSKARYIDNEKYCFSDNGGVTWFISPGLCGLKELTSEIHLPYSVPERSINIYVKELEDGTRIRITDEAEIKAMAEAFRKRVDNDYID